MGESHPTTRRVVPAGEEGRNGLDPWREGGDWNREGEVKKKKKKEGTWWIKERPC